MSAVYRRELYAYFTTPRGYVFTGLFVLVLNLFFYFANIQGRASALGPAFAFMLTVLMLTVPLLTMGLFAGEYRRGTDRLLFTAPVTLRAVVMGKLLAAMTVFAAALSATLIWAEIIALFGGLNAAEYVGNMVAILVFAAVYLSMGVLVSAMTASQTAAVTATLGVFGALFLADVAVSAMPDSAPARFLSSFSLFQRYDAFSRGVFSLTDIAFCVSACAVFVFLTAAVLQRRRQGLKGQWRHWLALAVPGLALLAAANLLASALDARAPLKLDLTRGKVFTLTEQTVDILRALPEPVTLTVLAAERDLRGEVYDDLTGAAYQLSDLREALEKYRAAANANFTLRYVDPELNPGWLRARDLTGQAGYYSLVAESARRTRVLSLRDLYETQTLYDYDGAPVMEATMGLKTEGAVTSAILNVITERLPSAAVIQGHAEYPLATFEGLLRAANFEVTYVNLAAGEIPADAALAVLAGPQFDLNERELTALDKYLSGGGNAIIALDPSLPPLPGLEQYLTEWGARFESAFVFDGGAMNFGDPALLLTTVEDQNPLTDLAAAQNRYLLLAGARPISPLWETDGNRIAAPLFSSFDTAYAKAMGDDRVLDGTERGESDAAGPFVLGLVCEQVRADGTAEGVSNYAFLVPLSLLADAALGMPNFLNRQLVLHWLSKLQPDLILDILPRDTTDVPLVLNAREASVLFWLLAAAMPLTVFGIGGGVWFRRRRN